MPPFRFVRNDFRHFDLPRFPFLDERPQVFQEILHVSYDPHGFLSLRIELSAVRFHHLPLDLVDMRPDGAFHYFGKLSVVRFFDGFR